jgi:hypothetical protein
MAQGYQDWLNSSGTFMPEQWWQDNVAQQGNANQPTQANPASSNSPQPASENNGIDLSSLQNIFSSSRQGLPDWGSAWAQDWLKTMQPVQGGMVNALNSLNNAPQTIENTRQNMVNQYQNAMGLNLQNTMKPVVSNLAGRGVINSSTAEGTMAKVLQDLQAKYADQVTAANTWAGNALLDNIYKTISAYQGQGSLINALLGTSREGTSQDPFQPYATILPFLLGNMG